MLYTCYFSGVGSRYKDAVSITIQQPPGYHFPVASELSPPEHIYWAFVSGKMSNRTFAGVYRHILNELDPKAIAEKYDGKIFTSWEAFKDRKHTSRRFSPRILLQEWLTKHGYPCEELPPEPRRKRKKVDNGETKDQ